MCLTSETRLCPPLTPFGCFPARGIFHALLTTPTSSPLFENPGMLPFPALPVSLIPLSFIPTEYHYLILYADRVVAVSRLDGGLVWEAAIPLVRTRFTFILTFLADISISPRTRRRHTRSPSASRRTHRKRPIGSTLPRRSTRSLSARRTATSGAFSSSRGSMTRLSSLPGCVDFVLIFGNDVG